MVERRADRPGYILAIFLFKYKWHNYCMCDHYVTLALINKGERYRILWIDNSAINLTYLPYFELNQFMLYYFMIVVNASKFVRLILYAFCIRYIVV